MSIKKCFGKRVLCLLTGIMMIASLSMPITASAAEWQLPTEITYAYRDRSIATVAAHGSAITSVYYLGGNAVTISSREASNPTDNLLLAVAGSDINANPDPYIWNYIYNNNKPEIPATEGVMAVTLANVPWQVDNTEVTLAQKPDVIVGIEAVGVDSYDSMIGTLKTWNPDEYSNYNPTFASYHPTTIYTIADELYDIATAMNETGKTGRYGDPMEIAKTYEKTMRGLQLYIIKNVNEGKVVKKRVLCLKPNADGQSFTAYRNTDTNSDTTPVCRGTEYLKYTAINVADEMDKTTFTPDEVLDANVDCVLTMINQNENATENEIRTVFRSAGITDSRMPEIYADEVKGTFILRADSAENVVGIPTCTGFAYPELINPVHGVMYCYEKFWHIKDIDTIKTLALSNFKDSSLTCRSTDINSYNGADIEAKIAEGLQYYSNNKGQFEGTELAFTSNIQLPNPDVKQEVKQEVKSKPAPKAPGKASISKLTSPKKGQIRVTWKKQNDVTGYQVRYSTKASMAGAKKKTIKGWKNTSKKITKLKAKKKYYVQVRTYKKASGKTMYSAWSATKSVKTK